MEDRDFEALLALWDQLGRPVVDQREDELAARLGLQRGPGLTTEEWRKLRVDFIDAAERVGDLPADT